MRRTIFASLPLALLAACTTPTPPPETAAPAPVTSAAEAPPLGAAHDGHGHGHGHDGATVHRRFDDAARAERMFEDAARDAWQVPERVLELLALAPDAKVADIGAATGYFPVRFARAVPRGVVYGVDIEPTLVNYLNLRARREGLTNLVALVCRADDPCLPEPVDLAFVCDTYHHIDDRVAYFGNLRDALRPGGRLAIVDYRSGPWGPPDEMKLTAEHVTDELARAGYALVQTEELPRQYLLVFVEAAR
jgi:SAM-dependent methyltransferase